VAYSFITLSEAQANLAQRLYDASQQFFAPAELAAYIVEALQTFNALANFQRGEFTFDAVANTTWYDLTTRPNSTRQITATDTSVLSAIEYALLEPQTTTYPLAWTGSRQFNLTDILNAIQQIRDQLLAESNCTINQSLIAASPGRTIVDESVMDIRRVCWIPNPLLGYTPNCLVPVDAWAAQSFEANFPQAQPGYPRGWRRSTSPPLAFDVDIPPAVPGKYDLLTTNAGPRLSTTAATTLPIPNDWIWVLKWGALGNLLSRDTTARDSYRAKYCQMRYKQGVAALLKAPALFTARYNDIVISVDSVRDGDYYYANWQGLSPGEPRHVFYAGLNQMAIAPASNVSMTVSCIGNMTLPTSGASLIQLGQDDLEAVLNEAQHIASFKCGGGEFFNTLPLHDLFLRRCVLFNSKLAAQSDYKDLLYGRAQQESRENPLYQGVSPVEAGGGDAGN
jgi:hypothetical protein